jgi:hypothetical protein
MVRAAVRRSTGGALGTAALATAIASSLSCRQIVGIQDNPPAAITSACGLPWGTAACASCVGASCCSEAAVCAGGVACLAFYECLGRCQPGDWQCRTQCGIDHPFGGIDELPALSTCAASHCESACDLTCGGVSSLLNQIPDAAPSCQKCFESTSTASCTYSRECATSPTCVGWLQCMSLCATPDCRLVCADRFGLGDAGLVGTASAIGVAPPEIEPLLVSVPARGPAALCAPAEATGPVSTAPCCRTPHERP